VEQPPPARPTLPVVKIFVDSDEYRCWHEVGHAGVCLHLGGEVEFMEFLLDDARGHARTRCVPTPGTDRSVACGGFAAEYFLLSKQLAEKQPNDKRDISQIVFHNASGDREEFWGRKIDWSTNSFSKEEDEQFMQHAIHSVAPIFELYFASMQKLVRALLSKRRLEREHILMIWLGSE